MVKDQQEIIQNSSTFVEGYDVENDVVTPEVSNSPNVVVENLEETSEEKRAENDAAESKKKVVSKGSAVFGHELDEDEILPTDDHTIVNANKWREILQEKIAA